MLPELIPRGAELDFTRGNVARVDRFASIGKSVGQ